jgi:putative NIF3 family GTP cyclohydrolase 1 type 2
MATTTHDIHQWLIGRVGRPLNADEGVMFGDPQREVTGATVCWMPSPENIRSAADAGHELLIHHESLLYPYPFANTQSLDTLHWRTNRQRLTALGATGITASRLHGTLDELWIFTRFASELGLTRVAARGEPYHFRVFEIEPTPYRELIERVKAAIGLPSLRATAVSPARTVRKVGLPWGGMGLFVNVSYIQHLIALSPDIDVMIAGETDNYGFRFCTECGIDVIETSHELSENDGLRDFAEALQTEFPNLSVKHIADPCVWNMA